MKKMIFALAALSMVALMGLTSCKKDETTQTGLYKEVLDLGKYMGKSLADVKSGLASEGWTVKQDDSKAYIVTKKVDGSDVDVELQDDTPLSELDAVISDANAIVNGATMFNQVGETYKFVTLDKTADFEYAMAWLLDDTQTNFSYAELQKQLKDNPDQFARFDVQWKTVDEIYRMSIQPDRDENAIQVSFMRDEID